MASSGLPLVSVVIPVYNGQDTIADAIRSVLAQTYSNFDLTIANNCSTDGTAAIAEDFARKDPRVRVYHAQDFVSVVDSNNRAFTLISEDAKYCKILGATICSSPAASPNWWPLRRRIRRPRWSRRTCCGSRTSSSTAYRIPARSGTGATQLAGTFSRESMRSGGHRPR